MLKILLVTPQWASKWSFLDVNWALWVQEENWLRVTLHFANVFMYHLDSRVCNNLGFVGTLFIYKMVDNTMEFLHSFNLLNLWQYRKNRSDAKRYILAKMPFSNLFLQNGVVTCVVCCEMWLKCKQMFFGCWVKW